MSAGTFFIECVQVHIKPQAYVKKIICTLLDVDKNNYVPPDICLHEHKKHPFASIAKG
jgi:hypothetical protein